MRARPARRSARNIAQRADLFYIPCVFSPGLTQGNVLVLTDSSERGERLARWIGAAGERPVVVSGAETFLMGSGEDDSVDLVVCDLDTDDPSARALLDRLAGGDLFGGVPQLHVFRDLELRLRFLAERPGAAALCMSHPPEAEGFQARVRLGAEVGRLRREAARSSIRDPMTGLYNRRYLLHRLEEEFSRARRYRTPLSLVFADIDHLKRINDRFGQIAGDAVIRRVAQLIRDQVRREDVPGRTGEESFGIVLAGNRHRGAAILANKIRTDVEDLLLQHAGESLQVRVSAGVSTYPDNAEVRDPDDLVRMAENALTQAKERGGNRVAVDEGVLGRDRRVVLVADADPALLDLAEDLLSLDDLHVLRAESVTAAIETARFRRPHLVVLDLQMASEAGSPDAAERIQALHPGTRIPVIGLSRDPAADPDRLTRLGVDRFLTKPFSLSLLRSLARELLDAFPSS